MLSKGNCCKRCLFLHLGQNIDIVCSSSCCFLFSFNTSTCVHKVLKRYILKFSNKLPISALVTPPATDLEALEVISLFPILDLPLEYFWHNFTISSNGICEISPLHITLRISRYSSFIPLRKIVLVVSRFKECCLDFCRSYKNCSKYSSDPNWIHRRLSKNHNCINSNKS